MTRTFTSRPDRSIAARLRGPERDLLTGLVAVLESVGERDRDPAAARLRVAAHPDDPIAETEYEALVAADLEAARTVDRHVFAGSLNRLGTAGSLSEEEAESWIRVIGDARLALAARLGIDRDGWEQEGMDDPARAVVMVLGYLQQELVEALSGEA